MRLIADGVVDRDGVAGLAKRLAYSERQLNRMMMAELGVGPLAVAREHRARNARTLIESTQMSFTDIAYASGFGSVRQFNDTIRAVFAMTPREMRARRSHLPGQQLRLSLTARPPFAGLQLIEFLGARAIPGIEHVDDGVYSRALRLPHGHGIATAVAAPSGDAITVDVALSDVRDLTPAVHRLRRLFDLDADPVAVDTAFADDPLLGALVVSMPGLRVAGSVDPFETVVRAIIGQQVSITGARTVAAQLIEAVGERLTVDHEHLSYAFPAPEAVVDAPDDAFAMPRSRRDTIRRVAAAVANGALTLDHASDRADVRERLLSLRGIGPWTADYVLMRALNDPDTFLPTDLGVRRALEQSGLAVADADRWRPWRSYALHHLWHAPVVVLNGDRPDRQRSRPHRLRLDTVAPPPLER